MRRYLIAAATVVVFVLVSLATALVLVAPHIKNDVLGVVEQRTGLPVSIDGFGLDFGSPLRLTGRGLAVGSEQARSRPFFRVEELTVEARVWELWNRPRRVRTLNLSGVKAVLPPRQKRVPADVRSSSSEPTQLSPVSIDAVLVEDIEIQLNSSEEGEPTVFQIHSLSLESFALDEPVDFEAQLTYPRPRGLVDVNGHFGPLKLDRAGETPISGRFRFNKADLRGFDGISGLLTVDSGFEGTLQSVKVKGAADIPDFMVNRSENRVPVKIEFQAERIGGNLLLRRVETAFLESRLITQGDISGGPNRDGKTVTLSTFGRPARVEDLIRFALPGEAPLVGDLQLQTDVRVLPGPEPFMDRLSARGDFKIEDGVFTRWDVQKTLEKVSAIGAGSTPGEEGSTVVSDFQGEFTLDMGELNFSNLEFRIPGTELRLKGCYGLEDESLDLRGKIMMKRSPSELVPEQWSEWAKILDPILRRGEIGTVIPIRITGTRSKPMFFPGY